MTERYNPRPIHRYPNGEAYRIARGHEADVQAVDDSRHWQQSSAVVDLDVVRPTHEQFVAAIVRELRIRFYVKTTVAGYRGAIVSLLRWTGVPVHELNRDHVRGYLEYLVDSEGGASHVSGHLSAIRTCIDKFCFRDITLGLATPRKPKRLPVVLSQQEVRRLLESAVRLRDKLLLGLMYATGMRVSEVVRVRWSEIDFDRNVISIRQGKGRTDRQVMLPETYRGLFQKMKEHAESEFLFPSEQVDRAETRNASRHLSARTAQRVMEKTVRMAEIKKRATAHSLRHSFATHSFEDGCDIRRIQKILGHVNLETTTIYVKVAKPSNPAKMPSPIDRMTGGSSPIANADYDSVVSRQIGSARSGELIEDGRREVGRVRVHVRNFSGESSTRVTLEVLQRQGSVFLTGTTAQEARPGYFELQFPPLEEWTAELGMLTRQQRERFEEGGIYERLRHAIVHTVTAEQTNQARVNDVRQATKRTRAAVLT